METQTFDRYCRVWKRLLRYILRTASDTAQGTALQTMLGLGNNLLSWTISRLFAMFYFFLILPTSEFDRI